MRYLAAAGFLWAISGMASAGVVYQWQTTATSPTISSAVGRIEISRQAQAARGGSYSAPPNCQMYDPDCTYGDPGSPVLKFAFRANAAEPTPADIDFDLVRGTGAHIPVSDWFIADFTISGRILTLNAYADTGATTLFMDSNMVSWFSSDSPYFGTDCEYDCSGASGQWVQVPEPGPMALLGIGAMAALLTRRRRPRRSPPPAPPDQPA